MPRRAGLLVVAVLGLAGVGVAHVLEYLALAPRAADRATLLADTGHRYLPAALSGAVFLALVAVAATFLAAFRRGTKAGPAGIPPNWARLLPVAQVVAFVALEIGERLAAGSSLADLVPVLVLGLPLQVLAGIAGGRLLSLVVRAGERLGHLVSGRWREPARRAGAGWRPTAAPGPISTVTGGPLPARGPPRLLAVA